MNEEKIDENKNGLTEEDWDILYSHGGEEIKKLSGVFTKIFTDRHYNGNEEPLENTLGEVMSTIPEENRNKIYKLLGRAILNCKKKGYLTHIKLK